MSTSFSHSEEMLVLFLLSNIDHVTMVTDFGECCIRALYNKSPKSLHELESFQF